MGLVLMLTDPPRSPKVNDEFSVLFEITWCRVASLRPPQFDQLARPFKKVFIGIPLRKIRLLLAFTFLGLKKAALNSKELVLLKRSLPLLNIPVT
jgi:hypothetical protein